MKNNIIHDANNGYKNTKMGKCNVIIMILINKKNPFDMDIDNDTDYDQQLDHNNLSNNNNFNSNNNYSSNNNNFYSNQSIANDNYDPEEFDIDL